MDYPYLDGDGARYLLERNVRGVGTDAVSIGGYGDPSVGEPAHLVLLSAGRFIVEDMHLPDVLLDGRRRTFCAFPILLAGAGAAWARPVAWDS